MSRQSNLSALPFLAFSFFFLTAFTGTIQVNEPLRFDANKGRGEIEQGEYGLSLSQRGSRQLRMEIQIEGEREETVVDFRFPRGKSIPNTRGQFALSAAESGHNYDLEGAVDILIERGDEQVARHSCWVRYTEWQCWYDRYGYRRCVPIPRDYPGFQDVRYYDRTTTNFMDIDLMQPGTETVAAAISTSRTSTDRVVTYTEPCRPY